MTEKSEQKMVEKIDKKSIGFKLTAEQIEDLLTGKTAPKNETVEYFVKEIIKSRDLFQNNYTALQKVEAEKNRLTKVCDELGLRIKSLTYDINQWYDKDSNTEKTGNPDKNIDENPSKKTE